MSQKSSRRKTKYIVSYDRMCIIIDFADSGNLEFFICRLEAMDKYFTEQQAKSWCKQLANGKYQ